MIYFATLLYLAILLLFPSPAASAHLATPVACAPLRARADSTQSSIPALVVVPPVSSATIPADVAPPATSQEPSLSSAKRSRHRRNCAVDLRVCSPPTSPEPVIRDLLTMSFDNTRTMTPLTPAVYLSKAAAPMIGNNRAPSLCRLAAVNRQRQRIFSPPTLAVAQA